jgi:hypothetical protein
MTKPELITVVTCPECGQTGDGETLLRSVSDGFRTGPDGEISSVDCGVEVITGQCPRSPFHTDEPIPMRLVVSITGWFRDMERTRYSGTLIEFGSGLIFAKPSSFDRVQTLSVSAVLGQQSGKDNQTCRLLTCGPQSFRTEYKPSCGKRPHWQ